MDISTVTDIKELKAMAFDQLVAREQADNNLKTINQQISKVLEMKSEEVKANLPKGEESAVLSKEQIADNNVQHMKQ